MLPKNTLKPIQQMSPPGKNKYTILFIQLYCILQRMCTFYFSGLFRSLLPVGEYVGQKISSVLPYITQEMFYDYHLAFFDMFKNQDLHQVYPTVRLCLDTCKQFCEDTGVRGLRYLQIMKVQCISHLISPIQIFMSSQGYRAFPQTSECIQYLLKHIPDVPEKLSLWPSSTHIDEHVSLLSTLMLYTLCLPIPLKEYKAHLQKTDSVDMIIQSDSFGFLNDKQLGTFFTQLNNMLHLFSSKDSLTKEEEDIQKAYQELAAKLLDYIHIPKFDPISWQYVRQAIITVFENNVIPHLHIYIYIYLIYYIYISQYIYLLFLYRTLKWTQARLSGPMWRAPTARKCKGT